MSECKGTGKEKPEFQLFPPSLFPRITYFCLSPANNCSPHTPFSTLLGFQRTEAPRPPEGKDLHGNYQQSPHPTPVAWWGTMRGSPRWKPIKSYKQGLPCCKPRLKCIDKGFHFYYHK